MIIKKVVFFLLFQTIKMKKLLKVLRNWGKTFQLAPISYLLLAGLTGYVIWLISTGIMPFELGETHVAVI